MRIKGEKGCFGASCRVLTPNGEEYIDSLLIGDEVYCYDDLDELHIGTIKEIHEHEDQCLYRFNYWGGEISATRNHWVQNQFGAFVEIGTLTAEDALMDRNGHLRPFISGDPIGQDTVYSITVEPYHTLIVNGIRAHNGGLGLEPFQEKVSGEKGGGKGGGGTTRVAVESPNTLQSRSTATVLDLISEGEIEGLVDGHKSIFFDDTPLQNNNDEYNFTGVSVDLRSGTPTQDYISGFNAVEREVPVGVELTKANSLTRTVTNSEINAIRIKIRIPQLTKQNITNGDLSGSSVSFDVYVKPDGGSFSKVLSSATISGKTTSPYERSYRIPLTEGGAPWEIKLERITTDSTQAHIQNKTFWSSYTELIEAKLVYPDSALAGISIDAQQFGSSIPTRAYDVKGIILNVPSNYDPITRVYTGIWDGTFKLAWSDNPAWALYDLLTNKRYGLGDTVTASQVDKWSLYTIAQYCDEMVDDGFGGTEPRMTFNAVINSQQEAYDVVNAIASAFRGMLYWGAGTIVATQDSPADPVKLVSPANVIGGQFNYEGAALKARHSVALVTWNDPADAYRPAIAVVEDPTMIQRYGWRQADVVAYGATSKGQAARFGKWLLDSEQHETETVTYRAALDHADVRPGDIVTVADPNYAGVRFGGRIKSATLSVITLDDTITLEETETYTLSVVLDDGTVEDKTVTNSAGSTDALTLESNLTAIPLTGAMWVLTASNVAPRPFRVIAVTEQEKNIFEITALLHDTTKYSRVEENLILEEPDFSALPTGDILPPGDISISEYLYRSGASVKSGVTLSWSASADPRVARYEIEVIPPEQTEYVSVGVTDGVSYDIADTNDGFYQFRIRAVSSLGQKSSWVIYDNNLLAMVAPPADVDSFSINIIDKQAYLSWSAVEDLDLSHYRIKFSTKTTGAAWGSATDVAPKISGTTTSISVAAMVGTYLIKAVDNSGVESKNATLVTSTIAELEGLNVIETITEGPAFDGDKTKTVKIGDILQLGGSDAMADWGMLSNVVNLTYGINGIASSGTYEFNEGLDLSAIYTSRLTAIINASGNNIFNVMSSWQTLISVLTLSGTDPSEWDAVLQVRTTNDDPSGTPVWSEWQNFIIGDYSARAFEWRVQLHSKNAAVTPEVSSLTVEVDMPDRVESDDDLTCPDTGLTVNFANAFKVKPAIAIDGQDMATGDYRTITNQSADGFDIRFFDSTGTGVQRTFDYFAKGYGRQLQ